MRYTEIIIYRRNGDQLDAYRQTTAYDHLMTKKVSIGKLFTGYTDWVAEQVNGRPARSNRKAA